MRRRVRRWLGLPVAVGIGPTKTLAKLANHLAKQEPAWVGVCDWAALDPSAQDARLAGLAVEETWGIGPRWAARLRADGLATVRDLRAADPATLGRRYGVVVARIVRELRGSPCLALDEFAPPRQEIQASRSFGRPVTSLAELQAAVAHHVARAAAKLRAQGSQTQTLQVVLRPRRAGAATAPAPVAGWVRLAGPTADAARLTQAAVRAVATLVEPGRSYAGAGVRLLDLRPAARGQGDWMTPGDTARTAARLAVLDQIDARWGRGTLRLAREGFVQPWAMRQDQRSPAYTTRWDDLPVVRAG
jgi:DNA polymerase V